MAKAKRKTRAAFNGATPTDEQMRGGEFRPEQIVEAGQTTRGVAYRRRPMIDILLSQRLLSFEEHRALRHYRHHADIADKSPVRDSLAIERFGGSGNGPGTEILNAQRVRDDCERAAGSLADILRAVVIYDQSLSQWAMERAGAIEECEMKQGKRVCRMKPRRNALAIAQLEIQVAAKRVMAELDAWG